MKIQYETQRLRLRFFLLMLVLFGLVITFSLLTFNLPRVRIDGDPGLPYLLSVVGYLGLFGVTVGFVSRFTASLKARLMTQTPEMPTPDMSVET